MKDKDIAYISAIAETGSITKAAEQLFVAQPSLTQILHRLEKDYDTDFFQRSKDGIRLTRAGRLYLETAKHIKEAFEKMQDEIGVLPSAASQLEIGVTSFLGSMLVPGLVRDFKHAFPDASLRLIENSSQTLEELAAGRKLDYAILHTPVGDSHLSYFPLYEERFLLAVSADDPSLSASSESSMPLVTKEMMAQRSFIMMMSNQRNRQIADRICLSAGIEPRIAITTSSFISAMALAQTGVGAAFVPESYARYFGRNYDLAYLQFPPTWAASWQLVIAHPGDTPLSDIALKSVAILQDCIKNTPEVFVQ